MKKVISIVLNNFIHDSRVLKENQCLKKYGYKTLVIALRDKGQNEHEFVYGVEVNRISLITRFLPKIFFIQLFKYFEFIIKVVTKYYDADIYHCNDLNALPIGVIIKLLFNRNVKIIYDAHEYEIERGKPNQKMRLFTHLLEGILIKFADKVLTVSNSIAEEYKKLYKIKKPTIVLNCPNKQEIKKRNLFREELKIREDQKIFLYQGVISSERGIVELIDAFSNIKDDKKVIVFMGYGPMTDKIKSCKSPNVYYHEAVSPNILLNYTSSADYGVFICGAISKSLYYSLPNKIFEYIHAGLPILVSDLYELGTFVRNNKIGIVSPTNSQKDIINTIEKLSKLSPSDFYENLKRVANEYCWETQEKNLVYAYKEDKKSE